MELEKGMDQKKLLKHLKDSGADVAEAKEWFKKLDRIKKLSTAAAGKYQSALQSLQEAERICMRLDELLMTDSFAIDKQREELSHAAPYGTGIVVSSGKDVSSGEVVSSGNAASSGKAVSANDALYETGNRREILSLTKDLKKQRNRFNHIFVIPAADTQFHLIFDAVLKMGSAYTGADREQLVFQSEVENLLDLMRGCFQRRQPNLFAYAFYSMSYGEELLVNLPAEECLAKIERVCRREYISVMVRILVEKLGMEEQSAIEYTEGLCQTELSVNQAIR